MPVLWTVVIDCIAWIVIHLTVAYFSVRLPLSAFNPGSWLYRTRKWEKDGTLYNRFLSVKKWKALLPSGGTAFRGFPMKRIESRKPEYLRRWLVETCRSELCHWIAFFSAFLFFLWNPPVAGGIMVLYAFWANMPCIVVQRYNRPVLSKLIRMKTAAHE